MFCITANDSCIIFLNFLNVCTQLQCLNFCGGCACRSLKLDHNELWTRSLLKAYTVGWLIALNRHQTSLMPNTPIAAFDSFPFIRHYSVLLLFILLLGIRAVVRLYLLIPSFEMSQDEFRFASANFWYSSHVSLISLKFFYRSSEEPWCPDRDDKVLDIIMNFRSFNQSIPSKFVFAWTHFRFFCHNMWLLSNQWLDHLIV